MMSECRGEIKVVIGGDLNGHLGRYGVGYEVVHGGFGSGNGVYVDGQEG